MRTVSKHLLFFAIFLSCSSPHETKEDFLRITITNSMERVFFKASSVVSEIEYVPLETNDQCLIGEHVNIFVSDNYIVAFSASKCFLFSRKGEFIRSIGQRGQGPTDFTNDNYRVKIDEQTGRIYLMGYGEVFAFHITGEFIKKLNLRELANKFDRLAIYNFIHWKDDMFCGNFSLNSGKAPYSFVIFTLDGEIVKLFKNFTFFPTPKGVYIRNTINTDASIYCFDDQLFLREILCDTLFRVSDQYDLVPEIVFDLPGPRIQDKMRGQQIPNINNYSIIHSIHEIENYLFLDDLNGDRYLYDKKNKRTFFCLSDPLLYVEFVMRPENGPVMSRNIPIRGLRNDIDGGLPIWPVYRSLFQNNQQVVTVYQSYLLKEKLTDEHFAQKNFNDPEAHQRLKNLLSDLNEFDNPVVMISTFK